MTARAPRSGAGKLARGTRFLRTPGIETHQESHPGRGARSPRHPFRVRIPECRSIPGVRKKRVPLANFPAPLRGAKCPNSRAPLRGAKALLHMLIDSHAHLDDARFDSDRDAVLQRAWDVGVRKILTIGNGSGPDQMGCGIPIAEAHEWVYTSVGIHPHDA